MRLISLKCVFLIAAVLTYACNDESKSETGDAFLTPDSRLTDLALSTLDVGTPPDQGDGSPDWPMPNWDETVELEGPGLEGVVIQPTLAFADPSTLYLAFAVLNPDINGIYLKRYSPNANASMPAQKIVTTTQGIQNEPDICVLSGGGLAVVWSVDTQDGSNQNLQIRYRIISQDGTPLGDEDQMVRTDISGNHWLGSVACTDDNQFVIVGSRSDPDGSFGVFVQVYNSEGGVVVPAVRVNETTEGSQVYPVAATVPEGGRHRIAVAYESTTLEADAKTRVMARFFDENLNSTTAAFAVSADGVDATQPSIHFRSATETTVVAATVDNDRIGLFELDMDAESARYARGSEGQLNYLTDLTDTGQTDVYSYLKGSGRDVSVMAGRYSFTTQTRIEHTVSQGWFPPYQTAIDSKDGQVAIAATERLDTNNFRIKVWLFPAMSNP